MAQEAKQTTVEPVIGTLINFPDMRRVNTREIRLANKCLLLVAVCYNLKQLLKWISETLKTKKNIYQNAFLAVAPPVAVW